MTGRLIAFEGGEAVGKSTQARLLAERLDAVLTHEPGDTDLGKQIRSLVLTATGRPLSYRAEALLMAADRAQHVAEVIRPALEAGTHVVTDRFIGSSLAYQGFGRNLGVEDVRTVSLFATGGLDCDLVVLLDAGDEAAQSRLFLRQRLDFWGPPTKKDEKKIDEMLALPDDRIGSEDFEFHRRVLEGYRALAAQNPDQWVVIDGDRPVEHVAEAVYAAVRERLESESLPGVRRSRGRRVGCPGGPTSCRGNPGCGRRSAGSRLPVLRPPGHRQAHRGPGLCRRADRNRLPQSPPGVGWSPSRRFHSRARGPHIAGGGGRRDHLRSVPQPVESRVKVIVCDRFHAAEPEAVASLLKTIEEPPPTAVIVLLSEEIPPTTPPWPPAVWWLISIRCLTTMCAAFLSGRGQTPMAWTTSWPPPQAT